MRNDDIPRRKKDLEPFKGLLVTKFDTARLRGLGSRLGTSASDAGILSARMLRWKTRATK